MRTVLLLVSVGALLHLGTSEARAVTSLADTLAFEAPGPPGRLVGWGGGPASTLFRDSTVVHGGRYAVRIVRAAGSESNFSSATRGGPVTFAGGTLELRGWIKTENVDGFAGLWLREDTKGRAAIQFDNMLDRGITGTTGWTEYRIALPIDQRASRIAYGVLLSGTGMLWADDLQLRVDGVPIDEVPVVEREPTAIERDREFDAGSRIATTPLDPVQIDNLATLARVWGFLKYHHPAVAQAKHHWDYELFRVMPAVLAAHDEREASQALAAWVDRIGKPSACNPCAALPDTLAARPRLAWIHEQPRLGKDLSLRLEYIYKHRGNAKEQHYVALAREVRNPKFDNEQSYPGSSLDAGYRLLALFRFWNIIEYWYPYRDLIDEDWNDVLIEFIPRLMEAEDGSAYQLALTELAARVDDGHSRFTAEGAARPPLGECRLPVALRYVEGNFVVSAYTDTVRGPESGLAIGDILASIDGQLVITLVSAVVPFYGASNETARMHGLSFTLSNGKCGPCEVEVDRNGTRAVIQAQRHPRAGMLRTVGFTHDRPGPVLQKLGDDVAYLKLSAVAQGDAASYIGQAAGTRGLIIDIRNYPSAFMPFELGGHLISGPTPFACFTRGDLSNPGAFLWTEMVSMQPLAPRYAGNVVILVDESSISQSEYTAMAFRAAPGAVVVGSQTAGADGNFSAIPLPGGGQIGISGIGVFYPDRRPTQQVGIVPDIVVKTTVRGIREGRDEVLEAAIQHIMGAGAESNAR